MVELPRVLVSHPHVDVRSDLLNGSPCIVGTRVPVRRIWAWHRKGVLIETLVKRYPNLGWAKVLSALAFAYDNQQLMAADLAREAAIIEGEAEKVPGEMDQIGLPNVKGGLD